eukprot:UN1045
MVELTRVLELIGCAVGATFTVLGVVAMLELNLNRTVVALMNGIATNAFLILFGAAAAIICLTGEQSVTSRFGFLATWSGRGVYFLLMGFYVFPATCPWGLDILHCLKQGELLGQCGVVAAITSIVLGIVILILRCVRIREDCSGNVLGQARAMQGLDYACAAASVGMLLLGVMWLLQVDLNKRVRDTCESLAVVLIVLIFGATSLLASCRASAFIAMFFGFLEVLWQRGLFYVLMGFYTFAISYESNNNLWTLICFICSGISIIAGVITIVLGCR